MLKEAKGNLIDMAEQGKFDIIVHGCNCQNTMGSGIAREMRERYPEAYRVDTLYHYSVNEPVLQLGNYSVVTVYDKTSNDPMFAIVNAYTQVGFMPRGVDHFEYDSFKLILQKLATLYPNKRFGFPWIGMGLAGGDRDRIVALLEDFAAQVSARGGSVTLVEFS